MERKFRQKKSESELKLDDIENELKKCNNEGQDTLIIESNSDNNFGSQEDKIGVTIDDKNLECIKNEGFEVKREQKYSRKKYEFESKNSIILKHEKPCLKKVMNKPKMTEYYKDQKLTSLHHNLNNSKISGRYQNSLRVSTPMVVTAKSLKPLKDHQLI